MSEVRIEMETHGRGSVFVDGIELKDVCGVEFTCGVGQPNTVLLRLTPKRVVVTGACDVTELTRPVMPPSRDVREHG